MVISDKYKLGEVVYLLTYEDQLKRVVTAIIVCSGNYILYELSCGVEVSRHVETEITKNKVLV